MKDNRVPWLDLLLSESIEGSALVENEDGRGINSKYGVTQETLSKFLDRECTIEDVKAVTKEQAKACALALYWNAAQCDLLPGGIDIAVADFAYNSSVPRAVKYLQTILGFQGNDIDGFSGPETISAARKANQAALLENYQRARMKFLRGLPTWAKYAGGWSDRVDAITDLAKTKISVHPTVTDIASSGTGWLALAATALTAIGSYVGLPSNLFSDLPATVTAAHESAGTMQLGEWTPIISGLLTLVIYARRIHNFRQAKTVR